MRGGLDLGTRPRRFYRSNKKKYRFKTFQPFKSFKSLGRSGLLRELHAAKPFILRFSQ
jgi:hypothetical protein